MPTEAAVPLRKRVIGHTIVALYTAIVCGVIGLIVYEHAFLPRIYGVENEFVIKNIELTPGKTIVSIELQNGSAHYRLARASEVRQLELIDLLVESARVGDTLVCRPSWKVSRLLEY